DSLMVDIAEYLEDKPDTGYLFESRFKGKPISTVQAYRILAGAGEACGYDYVGTHSCRKTFGFHYYKMSKDVDTYLEIINLDLQTNTKKYIGIRDDEIKDSLKDFKL